ncbi:carbonyl reductase family member 4 isoform X3 [Arapaima gigas]
MPKLCAVFGGSRGIGRAVAGLLAERGHRVAVISRALDSAHAVAGGLAGADHVALSCDVSDELQVLRTFDELQRRCGDLHYLVNAAGVNRDALLARTRTEDMVGLLHTNLLGAMLTCRASLRNMLRHQGGAIVNVGRTTFQPRVHLSLLAATCVPLLALTAALLHPLLTIFIFLEKNVPSLCRCLF